MHRRDATDRRDRRSIVSVSRIRHQPARPTDGTRWRGGHHTPRHTARGDAHHPSAGTALESLWLQLNCRRPFIIGAIYRPPRGATGPATDDLHYQLTCILSRGKPCYVLGDTNFDVLRPKKAGVTSYLRLLNELSLSQLITSPTHPGSHPSLIDHIITNQPDLTSNACVRPCDISDHDLIMTTVTAAKIRQRPKEITIRSTRKLNRDALCLDLLLSDWSQIEAAGSTTDNWNAWLSVWDQIIDRHTPLHKVKLKHQSYPWLEDDDVRAAMEARDKARADKERNPCEETMKEFRLRRNAVKNVLNRACSSYFLKSFRNSRSTTWKDVQRFLVSSKKPAPKASSPVDSDPGWADNLNQFFASVGPGVADALAASDAGETLAPRPPRVCSGALSLRPATLPELSAALKQMSSSRASGTDGITVNMLRETCVVRGGGVDQNHHTKSVVGPHLLKVINSSIVSCDVPSQWKAATVIPLHKKGDPSDPSNYRPISILSTVAKLCERVVCRQLMG